jgi:hypothetical protein
MRLQKQVNLLTIQDRPAANWIMFLSLYVVVHASLRIAVVMWRGHFEPTLEDLFLIGCIALDIFLFLRCWFTETIINKELRTITVRRRGLLTNSFQTYPFEMVEGGARLQKSEGSTREKGSHTIQLVLRDKSINLTARYENGEATFLEAVESINSMIGFHVGPGDYQPTLLD